MFIYKLCVCVCDQVYDVTVDVQIVCALPWVEFSLIPIYCFSVHSRDCDTQFTLRVQFFKDWLCVCQFVHPPSFVMC